MKHLAIAITAAALTAFTAVAAVDGQVQASSPSPIVTAGARADTVKLGTYDLELTTDDGTMTGTLSVKRTAGQLDAALQVGPNAPHVSSFVRDGQGYILRGGHDQMTITYLLTFVRDSLTGSFTVSTGMAGTVRGALRR